MIRSELFFIGRSVIIYYVKVRAADAESGD
ncbi:hypothetical protein EDD76_102373 [Kineothrix alysoides]|jgi:hypothetical protein|uniref:Uncharacterized protein n=1 Tax=Kineothrix alysoides TaxID=1469948 RepID=A0A4R1R581_9FIRM|nr:hypothetical protein EDD76_102373 [Kineothrix alysoides]